MIIETASYLIKLSWGWADDDDDDDDDGLLWKKKHKFFFDSLSLSISQWKAYTTINWWIQNWVKTRKRFSLLLFILVHLNSTLFFTHVKFWPTPNKFLLISTHHSKDSHQSPLLEKQEWVRVPLSYPKN